MAMPRLNALANHRLTSVFENLREFVCQDLNWPNAPHFVEQSIGCGLDLRGKGILSLARKSFLFGKFLLSGLFFPTNTVDKEIVPVDEHMNYYEI